ncbi:MAG: PEP-CTERM sorting domain-containing protein [Burkholderiales bacterium]
MKQLSMVGTLCAAMAGLLSGGSAQATLVDRGGGMLYDTVLNVTWLQDANYAATSGYCNTAGNCGELLPFSTERLGRMNWTQANTWAHGLAHGGYNGWRLARNTPVNGTQSGWNYTYSNNGSTDLGYNITSPFSELSYMYYVNLGLKGFVNPDGSFRSDYGVFGNGTSGDGTAGGEGDVGLVKNLQSNIYWSGTAYEESYVGRAWVFINDFGIQFQYWQSTHPGHFAWAVHDGDIAAVPVPGSVALLAGGLALLGVVTRRRKPR